MVDLPDDAIEVAKVAVICAARAAYLPLDHAAAVAVAAAEPVIAARVRAEALREAAEKIAPNQVRPSNVIIVGARMTDDVLDMVRTVEDALVAAVRAEAVAGERQRIKATVWTQRGLLADREHTLAVVNRIIDAAGSVPVATPPRVEVASIPLDELPDWTELAEAAGATLQNHEIGCSGEYETVMHWPDGRRAGNRDRLAIISEDAEMEQFANAAVGPVATRLQPGRVGFGTDAFEAGGSLPGQPVATPELEAVSQAVPMRIGPKEMARLRACLTRPDRDDLTPWEVVECAADQLCPGPVATPTEPPHMHNWDGPCPACASVTPAEPAAEPDLLTALQRSLDEARRPVAASPVPAGQPGHAIHVAPGHPTREGAGYDCCCGECLSLRRPGSAQQPDGWGEGVEAVDHPVNCGCASCVIDRLRESNDSLREQLSRAVDEIDGLRAEQPEER